jgi:hypothetical protein
MPVLFAPTAGAGLAVSFRGVAGMEGAMNTTVTPIRAIRKAVPAGGGGAVRGAGLQAVPVLSWDGLCNHL